jgi:aryl sulfotransferase
MQVQPPTRIYRTWGMDSCRWQGFRARPYDVVIATYPKCGTTWMQRIVGLLIFRDPAPIRLMDVSPWLDCRFVEPVEATLARLEAMRHRRFIKTHLPADGLPLFDELRTIVVARDGRDACLSYHHHVLSYTPWMLARLDAAGAEDGIGPYPRPPVDADEFFHRWLTQGVASEPDGLPLTSYFGFQRSWWRLRDRPNVLLLHYAELKADLGGAMRRVADFLSIEIPAGLWPVLIEAAGFPAMKRVGDTLLGETGAAFRGGGGTFFHKGENGRWPGKLAASSLALYEAKAAAMPPDCAEWLASGRQA